MVTIWKSIQDVYLENDPEVIELLKLCKVQDEVVNTEKEEQYRLKGISLMKNQEYIDAYVLYSEAVAMTKDKSYLIKFKLNLMIVCLKLKLTNEYGALAEEVYQMDPKNIKAIYHTAKFLILKGRYDKLNRWMHNNSAFIN